MLIVGKKGVGDAIDSYNMSATYFERFGCHVLGGIFNRLPESGYYALDKCEASVQQYFMNNGKHAPYGFLPELKEFLPEEMVKSFSLCVDVARLIDDVAASQQESGVNGTKTSKATTSPVVQQASRTEVEKEAVAEGAAPFCRIAVLNVGDNAKFIREASSGD